MANTSRSLSDELTQGFRWVILLCAFFVVGIIYMEWRFDDQLRHQPPKATGTPVIASHEVSLVDAHRQSVYIPAYSHVYHQDGRPLLLTVTLSVRNTDRDHEIALTSVRYYDSSGNEVKSHLDKPLRLKPLATVEFLIERDDTSGGSSPSFIVEQASREKVAYPMIETVMIDTERRQGISFARRGIVVVKTQDDNKVEQRQCKATITFPINDNQNSPL